MILFLLERGAYLTAEELLMGQEEEALGIELKEVLLVRVQLCALWTEGESAEAVHLEEKGWLVGLEEQEEVLKVKEEA